jgi:hypothetical protein
MIEKQEQPHAWDDYKITTLTDLFKLIEIHLREVRKTPQAKGAVSKESLLQYSYDECLDYAKIIRKANPKLIKIPLPTPNNETNLMNLQDWCTESRGKNEASIEIPGDLVSCKEVGLAIRMRSDSVARSMSNDGLYLKKLGNKYHCRLKHAILKWPERKERLKKIPPKSAE